jgi:hypothetical protein
MLEQRERLSKSLPAVSVTPETAKLVRDIAKEEGVKVAVVIRTALNNFLAEHGTKTNKTLE